MSARSCALVRDFAGDPDLGQFFCTGQTVDRPALKRESIRYRACALRRQGRTLAEIRTQRHTENPPVSEAYLFRVLQDEHRRISHISDLCTDEGAGLWAGLNVLPRTTYATDYSYRTDRTMHERLVAAVVAKTPLGDPPHSFNLDVHALPFRGREPDLEKHWVPMRNRALTAVMAFVAQAEGRRIMCYATANVLRTDANSMVPRFAEYGHEQTGQYPARLLFDSRATTYAA